MALRFDDDKVCFDAKWSVFTFCTCPELAVVWQTCKGLRKAIEKYLERVPQLRWCASKPKPDSFAEQLLLPQPDSVFDQNCLLACKLLAQFCARLECFEADALDLFREPAAKAFARVCVLPAIKTLTLRAVKGGYSQMNAALEQSQIIRRSLFLTLWFCRLAHIP